MRLAMVAMLTLAVLTTATGLSSGAGASSGGKQARQTTTFGSLGIVSGQAIRVSAVREPYEDLEVKACTVDLNFFDINGNRQATVTENLSPGKGSFLDLAWTDIAPPPSSARAEISAVVDVTSDAKDGKAWPVTSQAQLKSFRSDRWTNFDFGRSHSLCKKTTIWPQSGPRAIVGRSVR